MVELEAVLDERDRELLHGLVLAHVRWTQSALGRRVLEGWERLVAQFVKVMPIDERRARQARGEEPARTAPGAVRSPRLAVAGGS
jgi:glutamate synthase (NADPH) large chain